MQKGLSNIVSIVLLIAVSVIIVVGLFFFSESLFGPGEPGEKPISVSVRPVDPEHGKYLVTNPTDESIVLEQLETPDGAICDFGGKVVIEPGGHEECIMPTKRCKIVLFGNTPDGKSVSPVEVTLTQCNSIPDISFTTLPELEKGVWEQTKQGFEQGIFSNTTTNENAVTLYKTISTPPITRPYSSIHEQENAGKTVLTGDFDGDSIADIIFSSKNKITIIKSSSSSSHQEMQGENPGDGFGQSLALLNSTQPVLAVSAPNYNENKGKIYFLGNSPQTSPYLLGTCGFIGTEIANADLNADGSDELIVATKNTPSCTDNGVYIFEGPFTQTKQLSQAIASFKVSLPSADFNYSVSGAGDVNDDGFEDMLIGVPAYDSGKGKAFLFHGPIEGSKTSFDANAVIVGEKTGDLAGQSVSGAGDVNNDGFDDVIVGAPGAKNGKAYLLLGPLESTEELSESDAIIIGDSPDSNMGASVSGIGDIDADDYDDFAVGSHNSPYFTEQSAGNTRIFYGPSLGIHNLSDFSYECKELIGDLNKDNFVGFQDLLVMSKLIGIGENPVCFSPLELIKMYEISLNNQLDLNGENPCCADVTGDGSIDLIDWIALKNYVYGFSEGMPAGFSCSSKENCFDSKDNDLDGHKDYADNDCPTNKTIEQTPPEKTVFLGNPEKLSSNTLLGTAVQGGKDLNKDGFDDLLVGAPGNGTVHLINGKPRTNYLPQGTFLSQQFKPKNEVSFKNISWEWNQEQELKIQLNHNGNWLDVQNGKEIDFSGNQTRFKATLSTSSPVETPELTKVRIEYTSPPQTQLLYFVNYDQGIRTVELKKDGETIKKDAPEDCYTFYYNSMTVDTSSTYEVELIGCDGQTQTKKLF